MDVLNLMGATAALLSVTALARRDAAGAMGGIGRDRAGSPGSGDVGMGNGWAPGWAAGSGARLFRPERTAFSIFPWGSYLAFGLAAGSAVPFVKRAEWTRVMQWAALCGFGLLLGGQYFSNLPFSIYSNSNFWLNSPALVACKLGITLLLGSGAFLWTEYFSAGWSWVRLLGTTSLAVYWVHVELLYGRWLSFYKQKPGGLGMRGGVGGAGVGDGRDERGDLVVAAEIGTRGFGRQARSGLTQAAAIHFSERPPDPRASRGAPGSDNPACPPESTRRMRRPA